MENTETHSPEEQAAWSWFKKWLFRFTGTYLVLYIFPFPISFIPGLGTGYTELRNKLVHWVSGDVLQIMGTMGSATTGSGDRTFDYVLLLVNVVLALVISVIWTILDRRSVHYRKHYHWLMVYVRYYLGMMMMSYGLSKVFQIQFPYPNLLRLLTPIGDASPMGLAWTFMGYSYLFNLFTGLGEVIGGVLLFFRRTTTIGAFLLISVMATVVMMNFSYDIPVKLFSSHLLLMAIFLLTPDFKRLYRFFISNQIAEPAVFVPHFQKKQWRIAGWGFKALFIGYLLISGVTMRTQHLKKAGSWASLPPLYGAYKVINFEKNGSVVPPLTTDDERWKYLIIDRNEGYAVIQYMTGKLGRYHFKADTSAHQISMNFQNSATTNNFIYVPVDSASFQMQGILEGDTLDVTLRKKEFLLVNRGFHWVNEHPYNR